jgi:hypothetical protein
MSLRRLCQAAIVLGMALTGASGCGTPPPGEVAGTIRFGGKAPNIKGLEILFQGADGKQASAPVDADGAYAATGVPAGEVKVGFAYLVHQEIKGRPMPDPTKKEVAPRPILNPIPAQLRDPSTSGITVSVESKKSTPFDYDIVSRP